VARGLDDICGRLRNSSRSMVPELSCKPEPHVNTYSVGPPGSREAMHAGRTLSNFMNLFRRRSTSSLSTTSRAHRS